MTLQFQDWIVTLVYFVFVLGIGFALKRYTKTSTDFFLAGRSMPSWVAGLAFLSANLGAVEVIGMGASGAEYGISTSHFYWIGAVPAMVFLGIFMMPFYYGSKARSVPEFLKLRFDEKTRALNALTFAIMTVLASGVSMFAMADIIQNLHVLDAPFAKMGIENKYIFDACVIASSVIVLIYILLGGLTSAIYNEVLQFFLIVAGFLPLVWLGLKDIGGIEGLKQKAPEALMHSWQHFDHAATSPMGVEWFGLSMGLGFVLAFGYWCTDFLVVQRAMAAESMSAARRTPLIAAVPKMLFPFLVILPGIIAISLPTTNVDAPRGGAANASAAPEGQGLVPVKLDKDTGQPVLDNNGKPVLDYNRAVPNMLKYYFPAGLLGLGLTALLASFMSGMAGNVTAFNTVWTYDIYQSYIHPKASDRHLLWMGRFTTIWGIGISIAAAYVASKHENIMNFLQTVFSMVNAPLLATFLLGMFWKRTTGHGAFTGLLCGMIVAITHHGLTVPAGASTLFKGGWLSSWIHQAPLHEYPKDLAQAFWGAILAFGTCFILTVVVSLFTRPHSDDQMRGLVYSLTPRTKEEGVPLYKQPAFVGVLVLIGALVLNYIFF